MNKPSKFNVGDKVRVLTTAFAMRDAGIKEGDIVDVTAVGVSDIAPRILVNGLQDRLGFNDHRFELVTAASTIEVGSKVRITNDKSDRHDPDGMGPGKPWKNCWVSAMKAKVGDGVVYTVASINQHGVKLEGEHFGYPLTAFELFVEPTPNGVDGAGNPVHFTEADLKPGMRVVTESDTNAVVYGNYKSGQHYDGMAIVYSPGNWDMVKSVGFKEVYEAPEETPYNQGHKDRRGKLLFKAVDPAVVEARLKADAAIAEAKAELEAAEAARKALG